MTNRNVKRVLVGSLIAIAGVAVGVLQFISSIGNFASTAVRLESEGWLGMMLAMSLLGLAFIALVAFAAGGGDPKRPKQVGP